MIRGSASTSSASDPIEVWNDLSWPHVLPAGGGRRPGLHQVRRRHPDPDAHAAQRSRQDRAVHRGSGPDLERPAELGRRGLHPLPVAGARRRAREGDAPGCLTSSQRPHSRSATRSPCCWARCASSTGSPATELLVRVFPDEWTVDTFEEKLTAGEQDLALRYWTAYWQAGGDATGRLAAWRDLTSHVGPGRAGYVARTRRPRNPGRSLTAPASARSSWWWRRRIRCPRPTGPPAERTGAPSTGQGARPPPCVRPTPRSTPRSARPGRPGSAPAVRRASTGSRRRAPGRPPTSSSPSSTCPPRQRATPDRPPGRRPPGPGCSRTASRSSATPAGNWSWTSPATRSPPTCPWAPTRAPPTPARSVQGPAACTSPGRCPGSSTSTPPSPWGWRSGCPSPTPSAAAWTGSSPSACACGPPPSRLRTCRPSSLTRRTAARVSACSRREPPRTTPAVRRQPSGRWTRTPPASPRSPRRHPCPAGDWAAKTDGQWLAELLGIDPAVVAAVPGADGTDQREARAMNAALWPATWGYQLGTMLNPILGTAALDATRAFFLRYVSGRGPLPAVRVGRQPYGVLATTAFSRLAWPDADPLTPHRRALDTVLKVADGDWASLADQVAFVGADGDPHALLLGILGLHPTSAEFYQRYAQSVEDYFNRLNLAGEGGDRARRAPRPRPGAAPAQPAHPARVPGRCPRPRRGDPALRRAPAPLARAARRRPSRCRRRQPCGPGRTTGATTSPGSRPTPARRSTSSGRESGFTAATAPVAVLYLLLRHAVLEAYAEAALRLAAAAHALSDADVVRARREQPFVHVSERTQVTESRFGRLYSPDQAVTGDPAHARRGLHSGDHRAAAGGPGPLRAARRASACSRRCPRRASNVRSSSTSTAPPTGWTRGGSVSPRRSSSSCATRRARRRAHPRSRGIHIGAYGWLEEVRPRAVPPTPVTLTGELADVFTPPGAPPLTHDPANQGFIHAPSPAQAEHRRAPAQRVPRGRLPGEPGHPRGQPQLGAGADRTDLPRRHPRRPVPRRAARVPARTRPARPARDRRDRPVHRRPPAGLPARRRQAARDLPRPAGTAIESLEARNVVDGLALVRHVTRTGQASYPFGLVGLPVADGVQTPAIDTEVQALVEINDALADLAVAEGAHQAVLGNADRAAASMDAFTRTAFPPEPDVIATPHTGQRLNHRVAVQLRPGLPRRPARAGCPSPRAWPPTRRSRAGSPPCCPPWERRVPGRRGPTRRPHAPGSAVVTQADLGLQPIDLLFLLRPTDQATMTELDDRIVARVMHTQTLRADTELVLRYTDPVPGKISLFQLSPLVDTLRRLLLAARPARPSDYTMPARRRRPGPAGGRGGGPAPRPAEGGAGRAERVRGPDRRPDRRSRRSPRGPGGAPAAADQRRGHLPHPLRRPARHRRLALGLVRSGWGELAMWRRLRFGEVLAAVAVAVTRMAASLARADALLAQEAALPAGSDAGPAVRPAPAGGAAPDDDAHHPPPRHPAAAAHDRRRPAEGVQRPAHRSVRSRADDPQHPQRPAGRRRRTAAAGIVRPGRPRPHARRRRGRHLLRRSARPRDDACGTRCAGGSRRSTRPSPDTTRQ